MDMLKIARKFANDNIKKGTVDWNKLTNYSFVFNTTPKSDKEKPVSTVFMKSYFVEI